MIELKRLQKAAVAALEDIKARDIDVFDVTHLTTLFDRVIIASADSARQLKALAGNVQEKAKAAGGRVYGVEGEESGDWMLIDLGDIVVHIMQPAARSHYNLEELWGQPKPRKPRERRPKAKARKRGK
jgi:ribosome-associated protein